MKHTEKYLQAKWVTENPKGYDERDVARANSYCEAYLEGYNQALSIANVERSTGMECLHCQKDYIDDTIIVQYEGVYNYNEMMEYVNRCYGNVKGEVIEHEEPSEWQGYKNMGSVLIR